jgi:hypothetical protein
LGAGGGLTPSGDDFILGFLLSLNRWKHALFPDVDVKNLNRQIITAAYQKTTTLSANLIECAALGWADERLIRACDSMMSAIHPNTQFLAPLLGWGNSSGVDVFVGFVTAMGR